MADEKRNRFLMRNPEKADFNQYWYSVNTINSMVAEIEENATRAAFVSTPSLYFSLGKKELKDNSKVFDIDEKFAKDPGFVKYDFNEPEGVPAELHHSFDYVIVDPPFIDEPSWQKYTTTVKLLLKDETSKILLSTTHENAPMMKQLLNVDPLAFRPSIPQLVYQYNLYSNYPVTSLNVKNPEVDDE